MKLSEYPVGTTVAYGGADYTKHEDDDWYSPFVKSMASLGMDEVASEVEIISMPFGVVWQMAIMLADEYGSVDSEGEDITFQGIINDAVGEYNNTVEREAKKVAN